jgi:hypothetical protein
MEDESIDNIDALKPRGGKSAGMWVQHRQDHEPGSRHIEQPPELQQRRHK